MYLSVACKYPFFLEKAHRDMYLDKLIANSYQVRAKTVDGTGIAFIHIVDQFGHTADELFNGELFTVEDIDRRKGK